MKTKLILLAIAGIFSQASVSWSQTTVIDTSPALGKFIWQLVKNADGFLSLHRYRCEAGNPTGTPVVYVLTKRLELSLTIKYLELTLDGYHYLPWGRQVAEEIGMPTAPQKILIFRAPPGSGNPTLVRLLLRYRDNYQGGRTVYGYFAKVHYRYLGNPRLLVFSFNPKEVFNYTVPEIGPYESLSGE